MCLRVRGSLLTPWFRSSCRLLLVPPGLLENVKSRARTWRIAWSSLPPRPGLEDKESGPRPFFFFSRPGQIFVGVQAQQVVRSLQAELTEATCRVSSDFGMFGVWDRPLASSTLAPARPSSPRGHDLAGPDLLPGCQLQCQGRPSDHGPLESCTPKEPKLRLGGLGPPTIWLLSHRRSSTCCIVFIVGGGISL